MRLLAMKGQKLKVFISSRHGLDKYNKVRNELKKAIEDTHLAEVYMSKQRNISSAPDDIIISDCDICIFLIDNADGIDTKLQRDSDIARRNNKNSLYYFCDKLSKKKTLLESSLINLKFARSKTVHSFEELGKEGVYAIVNDVLAIYHYYCIGKMTFNEEEDIELQKLDIQNIEKYQLINIPRTVLKGVAKCKLYIMKFILGQTYDIFQNEKNDTNEIDEWGLQFLLVLFEGKSIRTFNTSLYLESLESIQNKDFFNIVQIRWKAIQSYFLDDIKKCIKYLEYALQMAKKTNQASWFIKDIQIDLRNLYMTENNIKGVYYVSKVQKELIESEEELYYPILDRIHESLHEEYIKGLYDKKVDSPYSVEIGSNIYRLGEMIASSFIVSMYNGSLTHILLIYKKMKNLAFYLCCKYDDWNVRYTLYKLVIFSSKEKEIKGIQHSYPELLSGLSSKEAASIINFCQNHPIKYQKFNSQLIALGSVGYYLNDTDFNNYEKIIVDGIFKWLNNEEYAVGIGKNIFKCLSGISIRTSQNIISDICCKFIEKKYNQWYGDLFGFMKNHIDLQKMDESHAQKLINQINKLLDSGCHEIRSNPGFLCVIRKQNKNLTEEMDKKIKKQLTNFYSNKYKLETTYNKSVDYPLFVKKLIDRIVERNNIQGKNGIFHGYAVNEISTVRSILLDTDIEYDSKVMDNLIASVTNTIIYSKESISTKLDAISTLLCIAVKYPSHYNRNIKVYERLYEERNNIKTENYFIGSSNIDGISLKIGLEFLFDISGKDVYEDIVELMAYLNDNIATTIEVTRFIFQYLSLSNDIRLSPKLDIVILQKVIQWLDSEHLDIIWYAAHILLLLSRNPDNYGIVNRQVINLIDNSNVYIKNLIMNNIDTVKGINDETLKYIISKCEQDDNYLVRNECKKMKKKMIK